MKKLLTLTALVAGVALFAGCMNQPTEVEEEVTTPVVEEVVAPVVEEVVTEEVVTDETVTPEEVVEPTAE